MASERDRRGHPETSKRDEALSDSLFAVLARRDLDLIFSGRAHVSGAYSLIVPSMKIARISPA